VEMSASNMLTPKLAHWLTNRTGYPGLWQVSKNVTIRRGGLKTSLFSLGSVVPLLVEYPPKRLYTCNVSAEIVYAVKDLTYQSGTSPLKDIRSLQYGSDRNTAFRLLKGCHQIDNW
jgi:hypothetical protein